MARRPCPTLNLVRPRAPTPHLVWRGPQAAPRVLFAKGSVPSFRNNPWHRIYDCRERSTVISRLSGRGTNFPDRGSLGSQQSVLHRENRLTTVHRSQPNPVNGSWL